MAAQMAFVIQVYLDVGVIVARQLPAFALLLQGEAIAYFAAWPV